MGDAGPEELRREVHRRRPEALRGQRAAGQDDAEETHEVPARGVHPDEGHPVLLQRAERPPAQQGHAAVRHDRQQRAVRGVRRVQAEPPRAPRGHRPRAEVGAGVRANRGAEGLHRPGHLLLPEPCLHGRAPRALPRNPLGLLPRRKEREPHARVPHAGSRPRPATGDHGPRMQVSDGRPDDEAGGGHPARARRHGLPSDGCAVQAQPALPDRAGDWQVRPGHRGIAGLHAPARAYPCAC
mmetsp:Transcript_10020/g.29924  ORF Transcript_10020/g.29924 Transcript_10020/m.29924 type:complete len:240 (-) Transcript_10020:15-734(-)